LLERAISRDACGIATSFSPTLFVLRFATALLRFSNRTLLERAISRDTCGIAATLSDFLMSARCFAATTDESRSLKRTLLERAISRDACGIATSLSDFLCLLAPASPTANESLRDTFGIREFPDMVSITYNQ